MLLVEIKKLIIKLLRASIRACERRERTSPYKIEMKRSKVLNNEVEASEEDEGNLQMISAEEIIEDEIRHRKTPQPIEESKKKGFLILYFI